MRSKKEREGRKEKQERKEGKKRKISRGKERRQVDKDSCETTPDSGTKHVRVWQNKNKKMKIKAK